VWLKYILTDGVYTIGLYFGILQTTFIFFAVCCLYTNRVYVVSLNSIFNLSFLIYMPHKSRKDGTRKTRKDGPHKSVMTQVRKTMKGLTESLRKQRSAEKKRNASFINNAQKKKLVSIVERIANGEKVKIGELSWLGPGVGYASGRGTKTARRRRRSTGKCRRN
jgi:hypothetical protein